MNLREWRVELWLTAGLLALNLLFLGHVGLFDVDEAIFAEATREMVETGDVVTPTYNYGPRWDKPPLIYWIMATPVKLFGPTAFGARFTSACAGALVALLLMVVGRVVWCAATGRWAGVAFATCLYCFALSRWSTTDMTLTLTMALAWVALFASTERPSPAWFAAAGAALGAATLLKGPVGCVLPGATWLAYLLVRRELGRTLTSTRWWIGVLVMLAVIAPWSIAIYLRHGDAFFASFLGYHNLDRLTTTQRNQGGPVWTYLAVAFGGLAPWSGVALAGGAQTWTERRGEGTAARAALWLWLWVAIVVGLFSVAQTKLPSYIAPAFPALALWAGRAVAMGLAGGGSSAAWRATGPVGLLVLLALGGALLAANAWLPALDVWERELSIAAPAVGSRPVVAGGVLVTVALMAAGVWLLAPRRWGPPALAGAGAVGGLALWLGVAPVVYHYQQGTLRTMSLVADAWLGEQGELATLNIHQPTVALTTQERFARLTLEDEVGEAELAAWLHGPGRRLLITRERAGGGLLEDVPHQVWARQYGYLLVGAESPPRGFGLPPIPWTERDVARLSEELQ